jgi:hypothetical protein
MAPPWSRKGRDDGSEGRPPGSPGEDDSVDLGADEHAWWARREVSEVWVPRGEPSADHPEPGDGGRDILADHLGEDWRTTFGFTSVDGTPVVDQPRPGESTDEEAPAEPRPVDPSDPYEVLDVDPAASWEQIVDAHRRQARLHHPDRLVGRPDAEIAAAEDRIRHINAAYRELKVRRGR